MDAEIQTPVTLNYLATSLAHIKVFHYYFQNGDKKGNNSSSKTRAITITYEKIFLRIRDL